MLKKAKIAILLVMALVFALQGAGMETAQAAPGQWSAEELTKTRLLEELGKAASTGVIAETYKQGGHSEANVIVDKVIRSTEDPFLVSGRGNAAMGYDLTAVVELPEYHLADEMTFGVYTREGNRYVETSIARKTVNVANKTEIVIDFGEITDKELYAKELYVLQVENRQPVENNAINQDGMRVEYGETVRGADGGYVYIGSMEYTGQPNQECKIFQDPNIWNGPNGERGYISELHLGSNIRLYKKVNNRFVQLNDSTERMEAVNEIYIRDDGWEPNLYLKLMHVTNDGSSYVLYGEHDFEVKYERSDNVAKDLLNKLSELSRQLANTELGVDGKLAEGVHLGDRPKSTGNSTDTGAVTDGTVVSLYGVVATEGTLDQGDLMKLDASETQPSALDGKGLPIADNEYVVFNVVVPAGCTTLDMSSASLSYKTSSGALQQATSWEKQGSSTESLSRVIWNVVTEKGGQYVPFEGTVYNGQNHGGILLAPKATIEVTATANASTLVGKVVEQTGMEIHQLSFNSATTKLRMTNAPAVKLTGTKYWTGENGNTTNRPESITIKLYASKYQGGWKEELLDTFTVTPDAKGNWKWEIKDLPQKYNGWNIIYRVEEVVDFSFYSGASGQQVYKRNGRVVNGFINYDEIQQDITNTFNADSIVIKGEKVWDDADDQDGIRPDTVKVTLQSKWSGTNGASSNGWHNHSDNLEASYLGAYNDTVTLSEENGWAFSFNGLNKRTHFYGTTFTWEYRLVEETVDGYTTEITGSIEDGYTITNTHTPETVTISGTKRWQTDGSSTPTEVTVRLKYADGTPVKDADGNDLTCKATAANNWAWSFPAQPKYKDGVEIHYTVTEDEINGYFTEIVNQSNGKYEIVNTIKKVKLQGQKVWDETSIGNSEAYRPGTVYIDVFRKSDDYLMATVFTNVYMSPAWSWSVELPAVDAKGEDAEYYIKERLVPNYTSEVKPGSTFTDDQGKKVTDYTVTNTFTDIDITVSKIWNDNNNADGLRPAKLKLTLMQKVEGGEWEKAYKGNSWDNNFYEHTLDVAAGETSHTFTGLLQYTTDGKKREFRVDETFLDANGNQIDMSAYTASQTPSADSDGDLTITLVNQRGDQELKQVTGTIRLAKELALYNKAEPASDTVTLLVRPWESNKQNAIPCSLTADKEVTITLAQSTADEMRWVGEDKLNITFMGEGIYTFSVWELYGGNKVAEIQKQPDGQQLDGKEVTIIFDVQENAAGELEIVNIIRSIDGEQVDGTAEAVFNNYEGEKELHVTKLWQGDEGVTRPDDITLNLFYRPASGNGAWTAYSSDAVAKSTVKNVDGSWEVTITGLPMYMNGEEAAWSVTEKVPAGYAATYADGDGQAADRAENGGTITNTLAKGEWPLELSKSLLNGAELPEGETRTFTFKLYEFDHDVKGAEVGSTTITLPYNGSVEDVLGTITFDMQYGEHFYLLEEVPGTDGDIVYDGQKYKLMYYALVDRMDNAEYPGELVMEDYAWEYYPAKADGSIPASLSFTNTYTKEKVEKTSIKVMKVWNDDNNAAGKRPESIIVKLLTDGVAQEPAVELNEANGWAYTWANLPKHDSAKKEHVYTVAEEVPAGYTAAYSGDAANGFTITNLLTTEVAPTVTYLQVTKVWDDNNNKANTRPESVSVKLLANGKAQGPAVELNGANGWTYIWENLPSENANGESMRYSVEEVPVDGYVGVVTEVGNHLTITNTWTGDPGIDVKITKAWFGDENALSERPASVAVFLLQNGEVIKEAALTAENGWYYVWKGLPEYDAEGNTYTYTVREGQVPDGYVSIVAGDAENGFTITNAYIAEEKLGVLMLQKSDRLNPSKKLAGAQYTLFTAQTCAEEEILVLPSGAKAVITTGENGIGTLIGVPAGTYWVKETKAPVGYELDPVAYKAVVELEPEKPLLVEVSDVPLRGALSLSKTVVADAKTNESFLFDIVLSTAGGDPVVGSYEATLNGAATQAVTFTAEGQNAKATVSLKDGETLVIHGLRAGVAYTVTEQPNALYDVQVNGVAATGATGTISDTALSVVRFQNTLKLISFSVKKEWTGLSEGETAPAIQLTLYCNGKAVSAATPKPDRNGWYTYTGLPSYVDGKAAVYTVKEEPMTGFTTTYLNKGVTGDAATECAYNGGTIVNSKIPQTGDGTPLALWVLTTLLAACGLLGVTVAARKREN